MRTKPTRTPPTPVAPQSYLRYNHTHNTPREAEESRICPYCGCSNNPDWLTCGEGQTWGCGGALGEVDEEPRRACPTFAEAGEAMRARLTVPTGGTVKTVCVTRPGISADEFERQLRSTPEYKASYAGQLEQLGNEAENLKAELGRAFLPLFKPLLKLFFLEG